MNYRYDYDIKDDFIAILKQKAHHSSTRELASYLELYHKTKNASKGNLVKLCIYRLSRLVQDTELRQFDCDVSRGVAESFQKTYPWLQTSVCKNQYNRNGEEFALRYELLKQNEVYRGDTMTSAWTTIKEYVKLKLFVQDIPQNDKWELYILRNIKKIQLSAEAGKFLQLTHTIGNFLPVPAGFNVGRSYYGYWDFWDLSLYQIYLWYKDNSKSDYINNTALERMFLHDQYKHYTIPNCQAWLSSFGTWENFIKDNYLDAFVKKNGVPKMFFKNHSLEHPLPETLQEFEEFFATVNKCIQQRGRAVIAVMASNGCPVEIKTVGTIEKGFKCIGEIYKKIMRNKTIFIGSLFTLLIIRGIVKRSVWGCILGGLCWLVFLIKGISSACPSCHKWYALTQVSTHKVGDEAISVLMETRTRNSFGSVIGTQEQYIPGVRNIYRKTYLCKNCGRCSYSDYAKDSIKV
ncbi:MAG: hypothetical protein II994_03530 [Lachnospiraceae bacterium]|nr:hypothetical protein [Lachnospiraceae bacterium]